ncbi:3364_t:CDS:1 [Racocetra fulgida]|uniref:3364_t:CDS:1 n=1 Tax=Racocetra fulgida TaxID=60492 RepID=A0A9N9AQM9_9GLOM|nr:3364_t:CDS:1 [Racocetra fulgida]
MYKKALNKVLHNYSKLQQLIQVLEKFVEEVDSNNLSESDESLQDDSTSDKENNNFAIAIQIQNLKKRQGKGRPPSTKRLKSSHENSKPVAKNKQQYKKYENIGHYQKNCKV